MPDTTTTELRAATCARCGHAATQHAAYGGAGRHADFRECRYEEVSAETRSVAVCGCRQYVHRRARARARTPSE